MIETSEETYERVSKEVYNQYDNSFGGYMGRRIEAPLKIAERYREERNKIEKADHDTVRQLGEVLKGRNEHIEQLQVDLITSRSNHGFTKSELADKEKALRQAHKDVVKIQHYLDAAEQEISDKRTVIDQQKKQLDYLKGVRYTVADFRDLLNALSKEEISMSRAVEIINQKFKL